MKSTGIIRHIDDLGRIVIPKEIRRTLRIYENDSLELFIDNGNVVFRKFSPLHNALETNAGRICRAIANESKCKNVVICDMDKVIGLSDAKLPLYGGTITDKLRTLMKGQEIYTPSNDEKIHPMESFNQYTINVVAPIAHDGVCYGAIVLMNDITSADETSSDSLDIALVKVMAEFLSSQVDI